MTNLEFPVPNATIGETIEVEARAVDREDHWSGTLTTSIVLAPVPTKFDDTPVQAQPGPGSTHLSVEISVTADGQQTAGEDGMRVTLLRHADNTLIVDDADVNGLAVFPSLAAGTYTVTSVGVPELPGIVSPSQTIEVLPTSEARSTATLYQIIPIPWDVIVAGNCAILSVINGFHQQYCNLNEGERDYAKGHIRQAVKFLYDGAKAIKLTNQVFPGTEAGTRDGTRANGFQHSVWNALMAISETPNRAKIWSDLHEAGSTTVNAKMDYHNNRVGYDWVRERPSKPDDGEACERMRTKTVLAVKWDPAKYSTPNVNPHYEPREPIEIAVPASACFSDACRSRRRTCDRRPISRSGSMGPSGDRPVRNVRAAPAVPPARGVGWPHARRRSQRSVSMRERAEAQALLSGERADRDAARGGRRGQDRRVGRDDP